MKTLIIGGRNIFITPADEGRLDNVLKSWGVSAVMVLDDTGVTQGARAWAERHKLDVSIYAGAFTLDDMVQAEIACVVMFPGFDKTAGDEIATKIGPAAGMRIIDWRDQ